MAGEAGCVWGGGCDGFKGVLRTAAAGHRGHYGDAEMLPFSMMTGQFSSNNTV